MVLAPSPRVRLLLRAGCVSEGRREETELESCCGLNLDVKLIGLNARPRDAAVSTGQRAGHVRDSPAERAHGSDCAWSGRNPGSSFLSPNPENAVFANGVRRAPTPHEQCPRPASSLSP